MPERRPYTTAASLYDRAHGEIKDYAGEAAKIISIVDHRHRAAETLLDVACGSGRHLLHFADRFRVAGVDSSRELLDIAAGRMDDVPLSVGDMVDLRLGSTFDVVTCLFGSVGYVRPLDRLEKAMRSMADHVAPGGLLIVEPWVTPSTWRRDAVDLNQARDLSWIRMVSAKRRGTTSFLDMHWLVAEPWGVAHHAELHTLELYTTDQYRRTMAKTGLDVDYDKRGLIGRGLLIGRRRKGLRGR